MYIKNTLQVNPQILFLVLHNFNKNIEFLSRYSLLRYSQKHISSCVLFYLQTPYPILIINSSKAVRICKTCPFISTLLPDYWQWQFHVNSKMSPQRTITLNPVYALDLLSKLSSKYFFLRSKNNVRQKWNLIGSKYQLGNVLLFYCFSLE